MLNRNIFIIPCIFQFLVNVNILNILYIAFIKKREKIDMRFWRRMKGETENKEKGDRERKRGNDSGTNEWKREVCLFSCGI